MGSYDKEKNLRRKIVKSTRCRVPKDSSTKLLPKKATLEIAVKSKFSGWEKSIVTYTIYINQPHILCP